PTEPDCSPGSRPRRFAGRCRRSAGSRRRMPAETLALDIHGARVRVRSEHAPTLTELRRDFAFFVSDAGAAPDLSLDIKAVAPPQERIPVRAQWRWRKARISQRGALRTIDYEGRALLEYDLTGERGTLYSADAALLHELSYLAIQSRAGDLLDRRALHRVRAP